MKNLTLFHSEDFNLVFFKLLFANTVLKISLVHRSDLQSLITTSTFLDFEITILRPNEGIDSSLQILTERQSPYL